MSHHATPRRASHQVYAPDAVVEAGVDGYTGYYCGVLAPGASPDVVFPPISFDLPEGSLSVTWPNYMYSVANETHEILCLLAESHPDWAPRNVYMGSECSLLQAHTHSLLLLLASASSPRHS
ncbi:unnamed protein product, partial [Closterium sp. NIES-54]